MAGKPWEKYQAQNETQTVSGPWDKYKEPTKEPGMVEHALERLDAYTGAPVRSFMGSLQDDAAKGDESFGAVGRALKSGYNQLGKDAKSAPTPQDIINKDRFIGALVNNEHFQKSFADNPMFLAPRALMSPFVGGWDKSGELVGKAPKGVAIAGTGAALDPVAHVPVTPFVKPATKAFGLLPEAVQSPIKYAGSKAADLAEKVTGFPAEAWRNYVKNREAVKALEKAHGGQVADAADTMREGWLAAIKVKKDQLNAQIANALKTTPRKAKIDPSPILQSLNDAKASLNPNIPEQLAAINEIDEHINLVRNLAPNGKLTPQDAFDLQYTLQGRGKSSYAKNGTIFNASPKSSQAARNAAHETRKLVNQAMPELAEANSVLHELHGIDDSIRPSLITPGKSNAGLMSTLSKVQTPEQQQLRDLGEWLGRDLPQEAKNFATYKRFHGMGTDASDQTGKALYRAAMGGILGGGAGYGTGDKTGAVAGAMLGAFGANPKTVRTLLDAGIGIKDGAASFAGKGGLLDKGAENARPFIQALERRLNPTLEKGVNAAEDFIKDEAGAFTPDELLKMLKGDKTYDLTKAREMAGPAKGLLPGEGGNPAGKISMNMLGGKGVSETDLALINDLKERAGKVGLTEKERTILDRLYQRAYDLGDAGKEELRNSINEIRDASQSYYGSKQVDGIERLRGKVESGKELTDDEFHFLKSIYKAAERNGDNELLQRAHSVMVGDWQIPKTSEQPRGLLTNLNVERGPVKEGITPSKPAPLILENGRPPELKPDTIIDLPNGKQVITRGEYSHFEPGKGRVYWVEPSSAAGFESGTSGKMYQISEKEMLGDKYADYFAGKQAELDAARNEWKLKSGSDETTRESREAARKAAEAKKVVSVDMKKARPAPKTALDKYAELKRKSDGVSEQVDQFMADQDRRYAGYKPPTFEDIEKMGIKLKPKLEKNGVKIWGTDSNNFGDQIIHYSIGDGPRKTETFSEGSHMGMDEFTKLVGPKKPKGKPTAPVDVPFGGHVTLKKATSNATEVTPKKYRVIEALDDEPGYLVEDPDTGKTFSIKDEDISGVFNAKGKPTKPKGKK